MAVEGALQLIPGVSASADLSAAQFKVMKMSGVSTVTVCAAITDKVIGVLQDKPVSGQPAGVVFGGRSKAIAGGTITAGDLIGCNGSGQVVTIVAGTDTTQYILGRAMSSGVSGDTIDILVTLGGRAT